MHLPSFFRYPKAQSYEVVNLMVMIILGGGLTAAVEIVVLQIAFAPANQLLTEWSRAQTTSTFSTNSTMLIPFQNATQLWPSVLTNRDVYNNVMISTLTGYGIFFAMPVVLSLFLSEQEPTRVASPKYIQYIAYAMLFVAVIAMGRIDILPVLVLLALVSPFVGRLQNAITTHFTGYSGTVMDMMGRSVKINAGLESVLAIFKLDKYRQRLGNISEPQKVGDNLWRSKNHTRQYAYYAEFKPDLTGDKTIINLILYKKNELSIERNIDVKELLRMRIAYLKDFMLNDHNIEVVDAPTVLAAGLAQHAQNEIKGISAKFERLGYLELYKNAAFGAIVVAASLYLLSAGHIVEGVSILVPGLGYILYDLQKKYRE